MGMLSDVFAGMVGGSGEAAKGIADQEIKKQSELDLRTQIMNMEEEKAKRLLDYHKTVEDTTREERVARVDKKLEGLINSRLGKDYSNTENGPPISAADSEVVEALKRGDRARYEADPVMRLQAANATGDLSDDKYATTMLGERRADRQERRDIQRQAYENGMLALKERGVEIQDRRLEAMMAKVAAGGPSATSGFVQSYELLESKGMKHKEILDYLNSGKTPVATSTTTIEDDGFGNKKAKTVKKGPARASSSDADALFPPK